MDFDDFPIIVRKPSPVLPTVVPKVADEIPLTPMALLQSYESSQVGYRNVFYSTQFCLVPHTDPIFRNRTSFTVFRVVSVGGSVGFHGGHPCATLNPGAVLSVSAVNNDYTVVVASIDIDDGTIELTERFIVPSFHVDNLGGDIERQKVRRTLVELDRTWNEPSTLKRDIFRCVEYDGGAPDQDSPLALKQGVVGCGKTYELAHDLVPLVGSHPCIVVASTNSGLASAHQELVKADVPSFQFTNEPDTNYSHHVIFKDDKYYQRVEYWRRNKPTTPAQRIERNKDRKALQEQFFKKVVLVTPSKLADLRGYIGVDVDVNVFVDEAAKMSFLDFMPVLLYRLRRVWLYGDLRQQRPWADRPDDPLPEDARYVPVAKLLRHAGHSSVAQWFSDMKVPGSFNPTSRRLPQEDACNMLPFYYGMEPCNTVSAATGAFLSVAAKWYVSKTIEPPHRDPKASNWMPPAIMQYPYWSPRKKEKEAYRMNNILLNYAQRLNEADLPALVITPYNHFVAAAKQYLNRFRPGLVSEKIDVGTIESLQGVTYRSVLFLTASSVTTYLDDSRVLVATSRHNTNLFISAYNLSGIFTWPVLSQLSIMRVIDLYSYRRFKPPDKISFVGYKYDVRVLPIDVNRLIALLFGPGFETIVKLNQLDLRGISEGDPVAADIDRCVATLGVTPQLVANYIRNPCSDRLVHSNMSNCSKSGRYKYTLLTLLSTKFIFTSDRPVVSLSVFGDSELDPRGPQARFVTGGMTRRPVQKY